MDPLFDTGRLSWGELAGLIESAAAVAGIGSRIEFISAGLLDIPYQASTLIGSSSAAEQLVLNLAGVDCFTFIDYVNAMRLSATVDECLEKLALLRYRNGIISYMTRNHFFTDWIEHNPRFVREVTEEIAGDNTVAVLKNLNLTTNGAYYLQGMPVVKREVRYIPAERLDAIMADRLRTGDFIGIYSAEAGLDVSHVGIFIRTGKDPVLRHASSISGKVLDQHFHKYMEDKPGLLVLRPV